MSRRQLLVAGFAAGSGFFLGLSLTTPTVSEAAPESFSPNAFIRIARDGTVTLTMPYIEMGQGTYTSVPMLIAEELEIDLASVTLEHAPANEQLYSSPIMGAQETDGSLSMRAAWEPMRQAGAAARMMLVAAAAKTWRVDARECHAADGFVIHTPTSRRVAYGDLVELASTMPVPSDIALKDPSTFRLIGTPVKRLDSAPKVNGTAQFGIDVKLPGMKIAAVSASPVLGGKVKDVDDSAARAVNGVRDIVRIEDAVAVIADHWAAAKKGLDALVVTWDDGPNADFSTDRLAADFEAAAATAGVVAINLGDETGAFGRASKTLEATYTVPLLAHAAMEPVNCTVHLKDGRCDVWVGTQAAGRALAAAAATSGLPADKVTIHNQYLGGSFGRRAETDNIIQAIRIARQVSYPVKVIWSREEDTQHDFYRPYYLDRFRAGLGEDGLVKSWFHRVVGASPLTRWMPAAIKDGHDPDATTSAAGPYTFPNVFIDHVLLEEPAFRSGFWRGVGTTHNAFTVEGFMDELASAAGKDPIAFRRAHLNGDERLLRVLDMAAKESDWGAPLPEGSGRGISLLQDFGGTVLAQVAEVAVDKDGTVHVKRVTSVIDCGKIINPDTIAAQVQGGVIFGLSAALHGEITFTNGRVDQGNFDSYAAVRMDEAPRVTVHLIESGSKPLGVGESGTAGIGPAVANAVFAATGKRLRKLPIDADALKS
jgi:isoquinoline 1-oxidoreductase beta subunit